MYCIVFIIYNFSSIFESFSFRCFYFTLTNDHTKNVYKISYKTKVENAVDQK